MTNRIQQAQSLHDEAIAARENAWKKTRSYVESWTNPNGSNGWSFEMNGKKYYPDLIIKARTGNGDETMIGIEEVETADSVNADEVQQWKDYAALRKGRFYLLVPSGSVGQARKLAQGLALKVVGYSRGANGVYTYADPEDPDQ